MQAEIGRSYFYQRRTGLEVLAPISFGLCGAFLIYQVLKNPPILVVMGIEISGTPGKILTALMGLGAILVAIFVVATCFKLSKNLRPVSLQESALEIPKIFFDSEHQVPYREIKGLEVSTYSRGTLVVVLYKRKRLLVAEECFVSGEEFEEFHQLLKMKIAESQSPPVIGSQY